MLVLPLVSRSRAHGGTWAMHVVQSKGMFVCMQGKQLLACRCLSEKWNRARL